MKAFALTLSILLGIVLTGTAGSGDMINDKNIVRKHLSLKRSLNKEVNKHIFYPQGTVQLEGSADVMLQIYPDGTVRTIMIQTKNPEIREFIENQVRKMKVDKDSVIIGEVFRYRINFKRSC